MHKKIASFCNNLADTRFLSAVIIIAYGIIRGYELHNFDAVRAIDDSPGNFSQAALSFTDPGFWAGRPLVVPLIYKVFGFYAPSHGVVVLQVAVSFISWSIFSYQASCAILSKVLQPFVFVLLLLFSLSINIISWDNIALNESLSVSLMVLLLGFWFWLHNNWRWYKAACVIAAGSLWCFARDTNSWVVLSAGLFVGLIGILYKTQRKYLIIAFAFIFFFSANFYTINIAQRWVMPLINIMGRRILPNINFATFFAVNGMPISPQLIHMAGKFASDEGWTFSSDQALAEFQKWVHTDGEKVYLQWLLSQPLLTLKTPISLFYIQASIKTYSPSFVPLLPQFIDKILYPYVSLTSQELILVVICTLIAIALRAWQYNRQWFIVLAVVALLYPHAFIVWHGDTMEIGRHALAHRVQFNLALWLLLCFLADILLIRAKVYNLSLVRK